MTFPEAIRDGFDHYVKFDGRASRSAFWWFVLFFLLLGIGASIIDSGLFDGTPIFGLIVYVGLFLPYLSVWIRRLHDTDHSGWWLLIGLIPFAGAIILLVFALTKSDQLENQYGPPPATSPAPATSAT